MTVKIFCHDYGFECNFAVNENLGMGIVRKLKEHFEKEHDIDYSEEAVIQMLVNKGHSRESIKSG